MISIIIPTLNEEKIIASTLRMLSALTLPHEVIVSDGASTDATAALAREQGARVVVFAGPGRQNISQGRNLGAQEAAGDILVFLDADCIIPNPDKFFTHALAHFEQDPSLVALTAPVRVVPEDETWGDMLAFGAINLEVRLENNILRWGEALGEFQMMRRDAFERLGGYREDLITREDVDMFRRLAKIGRVMTDPDLTVYQTGRRAHQIGWPRMIGIWLVNVISVIFRGKAYSKEWKVIR